MKNDRAAAIEDAAYRVLAEKGFKGTSMLAVARAAKASNETLYRWYGDKLGLFAAMIARNTEQVEAELARVQGEGGHGLEALESVAQTLLTMVTGNRAILLNRAAAADATGALGAALASGGRARVQPLIVALLQETYGTSDDAADKAEVFLSLLIGDLQIRRAIGAQPPLTQTEIAHRTARALQHFQTLYPTGP